MGFNNNDWLNKGRGRLSRHLKDRLNKKFDWSNAKELNECFKRKNELLYNIKEIRRFQPRERSALKRLIYGED